MQKKDANFMKLFSFIISFSLLTPWSKIFSSINIFMRNQYCSMNILINKMLILTDRFVFLQVYNDVRF